ncbi:MAG TPA: cupin domain-containing protein [Pseudonocardiaceae bacterium]|jgi:quercetin dioxygenase-like cupin family protein|nr:cupin domain-containing protein [Pseudonocardiaceae bacterium]
MTKTLTITPSESVTVLSSTPDLLEMEATYASAGHPPPRHWHPSQDEHFEVLSGSVRVTAGEVDRVLTAGERIDIPHGTVHQFWNESTEPATVRWLVRPAGRSVDWFTSIDALQRTGRVGRDGMPGILAFAVFLTEYRDVFRLATPAAPLVRAALALLARLGRLCGYRPTRATAPQNVTR